MFQNLFYFKLLASAFGLFNGHIGNTVVNICFHYVFMLLKFLISCAGREGPGSQLRVTVNGIIVGVKIGHLFKCLRHSFFSNS